ncbi:phosphatidylinositol phosphate synthase [Actinomadura madurae]|uniref:Phosphatidylinositol phosphate synthase n=1 Tax=Actinomadura madurae TaxID=1993 RepID=A0A1I5WAE3_9ACTN|nr:CDP-alcohol phosphatidyltransferase family protein [Actinomadura madurae]SFQ16702.1 CDP-diacylglycerol--glycerol-3-phosphate 3-phosphatidyltransferase [Actinomadura madurae]SPT57466.1 CDP-diacylglycerol--inositol 3-phosphatidyltransferase [Actinomadura madurae]
MLNKIRPALGRVLTPVGQAVARTGVSPNAITVIGTAGVAAGALVLFPRGEFFWGTMVITAFVLFDMLDGAVARVTGKISKFGAFLDSTMDRVADAAIFSGLMIGLYRDGQEPLAAVALYCLVSGVVVSYAKARAEGLGYTCDVGIAERAERLIVALVAAGFDGLGVPFILAVALWALAVLSTITVGQRFATVYVQARDGAGPGAGDNAGNGAGDGADNGAGNGAQKTPEPHR